MIHRQDQTLSSISGTLDTLTQQAGLIGQETEEQNELVEVIILKWSLTYAGYFRLLDDLGQNVDRTDTKLGGAMKKMRKFIRETEGLPTYYRLIRPVFSVSSKLETKSGWCITILIIILIILLAIVMLA